MKNYKWGDVRRPIGVSGTECASKVTRVATEVRKAMNHPDTARFVAAQIIIASWYLDRTVQSVGEDSSRYLHYARQAYEIVMQLQPKVNLDETSRQVHQELSVLRQRLRVAQSGPGDLNDVAIPSSALLGDSGAS